MPETALDRAWKGVLAAIYDSFGQIPKNVGDALECFKGAKIEPPTAAHDLYLEAADGVTAEPSRAPGSSARGARAVTDTPDARRPGAARAELHPQEAADVR